MATKQERIDKINSIPPGSFLLVKKGPLFWMANDDGYSADVTEAKIFHRSDIIERLSANGLIDKSIISYDPKETI